MPKGRFRLGKTTYLSTRLGTKKKVQEIVAVEVADVEAKARGY